METCCVYLKNERVVSYNRLGLLIMLMHVLYAAFFFMYIKKEGGIVVMGAGFLVALVGFILNFSSGFRNKKPLIPFSVLFMICSLVWIYYFNYWLAAAFGVLAVMDLAARLKPAIVFDTSKIEIRAFPKKRVQWIELNNVMLKDHILTLDFKNDRLIQAEISPESNSIDENAFNSFCQARLNG